MLRTGFHSAFCVLRMQVNRTNAIVENSIHKVWNGQIGKSDLDLVWKKMGPLQVIHTQEG
jgi:hypothetical protein